MPASNDIPSMLPKTAQKRLNSLAESWSKMELFQAINSIAQMLQRDVFIVGGVLRDSILNRDIHDFDLAVAADALPFAQLLSEAVSGVYVPLDEIHGSARVVLQNGDSIDITDFRRSTFEKDCLARDFTCNGLSAPLTRFIEEGAAAIIDPCNGIKDIENHVLKMIREENFSEDPLRVLRLFRYAATLNFDIDPETLKAASKYSSKITDVASERILAEFQYIVGSENMGKVFMPMEAAGVFTTLFPYKTKEEIATWVTQSVDIESFFYRTPSLPGISEAVKDRVGFLLVTIFAALKPDDHISDFAGSLRLSNKTISRISKVEMSLPAVKQMVYGNLKPEQFLESVARITLLLQDDRLAPWLILMAQESDNRINSFLEKAHDLYFEKVQPVLDAEPIIVGKELIEIMKKEPGPWVSEVLEAIFYNRLHGNITDKKSAIKFSEKYLRDSRL